jgi:hypothetical protein
MGAGQQFGEVSSRQVVVVNATHMKP